MTPPGLLGPRPVGLRPDRRGGAKDSEPLETELLGGKGPLPCTCLIHALTAAIQFEWKGPPGAGLELTSRLPGASSSTHEVSARQVVPTIERPQGRRFPFTHGCTGIQKRWSRLTCIWIGTVIGADRGGMHAWD